MDQRAGQPAEVTGEFVDLNGDRWYVIRNIDAMAPFFMSVISSDDHWLFVSSTGGLTCGRISADFALFPYVTVDRVHESLPHTGPKTLVRVREGDHDLLWEPFATEPAADAPLTRNLYKSVLSDRLCFEEHHQGLDLLFRYTWLTSKEYGFVRSCELINVGTRDLSLEVVDGLQNVLPAGTPLVAQTQSGNLVDAYKWSELDERTGLALFTLYSGITDRAEPCESLRATPVFSLGFDPEAILLSSRQLERFRHGGEFRTETLQRGIRGAYFVARSCELAPGERREWRLVANLERGQGEVAQLRRELADPGALTGSINRSLGEGRDELVRFMGAADGFQATAEEHVTAHHYANTLFNVLRGGIFVDQYNIQVADFRESLAHFNGRISDRHGAWFDALPETVRVDDLLARINATGDPQLGRLAREYLPITFGRRHGDPSRPWNRFAIRLRDDHGNRRLYYEGNWRDIFQNWEALAISYPEFLPGIIAKFVNASTVDGFNPYRITRNGIDWEVEEPDDPWSYIGYWGDHQIIYLLKLLEHARAFDPQGLDAMLTTPEFCYANVPYRIAPFESLLADAKNTVSFDEDLATRIDAAVASLGADGKLLLDDAGEVVQVTLLEKLLVPLLAKLGNLVLGGGIWLNTQRPEWNDANNALVGNGLSMVTLYYLRRYVTFLDELLAGRAAFELSAAVEEWLAETLDAFRQQSVLEADEDDDRTRFALLRGLGSAFSRYRERVYVEGLAGTVTQDVAAVRQLLDEALVAIDRSIALNRQDDGLYHAYNLLEVGDDQVGVGHLYPMLEGQVAVLSSGALSPEAAIDVLEHLFASPVFRGELGTFMLYPDRRLPRFLDRNRPDPAAVDDVALLRQMLADGDTRLVYRDVDDVVRFNAAFTNAGDVERALDEAGADAEDRAQVLALYEAVFDHQAFTGRSGTMFGFEGLGCVYWHMVAKLLLAVQENFFRARDTGADAKVVEQLARLYYRVRAGIGFNKTPVEYGAFPVDPYSHTPGHSGASQPGMTGQVKEEILTRFGELGVRVQEGMAAFDPSLLRRREFRQAAGIFCVLTVDGDWEEVTVPRRSLAFSWCQVPVLYRLEDGAEGSIAIKDADGRERTMAGLRLSRADSQAIFARSGAVRRLTVTFDPETLLEQVTDGG